MALPVRLVETRDGKPGRLWSSGPVQDPLLRTQESRASERVSAMELLTVKSEVRPEAVLVHASGEIDSGNAAGFRTQLASALQQAGAQESRLLIIDLQGVTYFGSAGMNAVLDCHKIGLRAGTAVRLVAENDLVVRPIEVTNLDSLLDLYPTLAEALKGRESEQGT